VDTDPRRASAADSSGYDVDRVWTVPNMLSFLRLLGVPIVVWLILGPQADAVAVIVLVVAGLTDWLDGYLARAWNQRSRIGQLLDPVADRLYILAIIGSLAIRGLIPWWLVVVLAARDVAIAALVPLLHTRGYSTLPVHFLGKAATFCLLYAFPLVLLGAGSGPAATGARVVGWAFALWGTGLYWWAGILYIRQTLDLLRSTPVVAKEHRPIGPPHEGPMPREGQPPEPRRRRQRDRA
jgi:cardiolipin synthase